MSDLNVMAVEDYDAVLSNEVIVVAIVGIRYGHRLGHVCRRSHGGPNSLHD